MSIQDVDRYAEWHLLWDEFYNARLHIDDINKRLVIEKMRLRAQGIATPRPAPPRPVAPEPEPAVE